MGLNWNCWLIKVKLIMPLSRPVKRTLESLYNGWKKYACKLPICSCCSMLDNYRLENGHWLKMLENWDRKAPSVGTLLARDYGLNFISIRQQIEKMKIEIVWISWTSIILWGFKKFFFKQIIKVSAFYLEKQKSFIPKKNVI